MLVLFDLNGTLLDPAGVGDPWGRPDLGRAVLRGAVQGAVVDTLSGVTGTERAGLRTTRVARAERELTAAAPAPDVRAPDLLGAARRVTAR